MTAYNRNELLVTASCCDQCLFGPRAIVDDRRRALRALGLEVVEEKRLEALGFDQRVPCESAAILEYAGARWAVEPTDIHNALDLWAEPWMDHAWKALRKAPEFRTKGIARRQPSRAPFLAAGFMRALVRAAAEDPMLIQALATTKTLTTVGGRGEAMAAMLKARGIWTALNVHADPIAWERALALVGEL